MHTHWCRHAHKHATPPPQCVKVLIGMRAHVKMSIYHLPVCIYLSHKWINTHTQVDPHPQVNGHFHTCPHTNVHFQPLIQFNTNRKFHACTHTHTHTFISMTIQPSMVTHSIPQQQQKGHQMTGVQETNGHAPPGPHPWVVCLSRRGRSDVGSCGGPGATPSWHGHTGGWPSCRSTCQGP